MALTDSLISYWKLDEASGDALDAHGSNTLTDNNGVGSAAGKIGNARDFEADNSQRFSKADNASLSLGSDVDFTFSVWVKLESKVTYMQIIGKWDEAGAVVEYILRWNPAEDRFTFYVGDGSSYSTLYADSLGAPSTGTWYFIVAWHDKTANTTNIQVNNGTVDSASWSNGTCDSSHTFFMGGTVGGYWMDGLIDEVGFWKRVLTGTERTALYNSGSGLVYPFGPASLKNWGGITIANIKTLGQGTEIANVKNWDGVV